ncbi:MAG: DNA replication protein [Rhodospirillaceae bacterium]|nr:DNA replication protein [Rhodospirillaceae bacterium]
MSEARTATQLALDLGHRPAFGREDFLVAPGNQDAVEWIDRWPEWPGHILALFGPAGCGKSHLAQVFALRAQAVAIAAPDLTTDAVGALLGKYKAFLLEEGEACDERALFHLFNGVRESKGTLLLTGREPPARWATELKDLKSRLSSIPAVPIAPPDDAMMEAVLVKLFSDRQLGVAPDVIAYVLRRIDRSFAAARRLVATADKESLAGKRPITIPLMKTIIGEESV